MTFAKPLSISPNWVIHWQHRLAEVARCVQPWTSSEHGLPPDSCVRRTVLRMVEKMEERVNHLYRQMCLQLNSDRPVDDWTIARIEHELNELHEDAQSFNDSMRQASVEDVTRERQPLQLLAG